MKIVNVGATGIGARSVCADRSPLQKNIGGFGMGKLRIAAATPKIEVANCDYNTQQIIGLMKKADAEGVQLLCLPELCITGATCGDLFFQPTLIDAAQESLLKLVDESKDIDMVIVVGLPVKNQNAAYNAMSVLSKGKILGFVGKYHNPMHPDAKYFHGAIDSYPHVRTIKWKNEEIPLASRMPFICENIRGSALTIEIGHPVHRIGTPHIIVNSSVNREIVDGFFSSASKQVLAKHFSVSCNCIYVQAAAGWGESTTDMVFSGHNLIAQGGEILVESPPFGDGWAMADVEYIQTPRANIESAPTRVFVGGVPRRAPACHDAHPFISLCPDPEHALQIQTAGLAKRLSHTKGTAVIGVSGGLDSCLALLVTARAYQFLGRLTSDIVAVTLPCYGTTPRTKSNAHALCAALGIPCREIDITASVALHLQDIGHPQGQYDVVFENAQARMRTMVLMNIANQTEGGFVVGTGSLSEIALGWATYNGDHMSMYAVNAGVPKTLVRHLVEHVAKTCGRDDMKKVLESILATKVSPELLPAPDGDIVQITEELVGPYELHDFFIYHALVMRRGPKEILSLAEEAFAGKYPRDVILHWLRTFYRRFFSQQFKRNCLPDSPQVVPLSFSSRVGFQMPSDASGELWLKELL